MVHMANKKKTGMDKQKRVHLVKTDGRTIGCGYDSKSFETISGIDAQQVDEYMLEDYAVCSRCFKLFTWDNTLIPESSMDQNAEKEVELVRESSSSEDSSDMEDSDTMEENDSLSEVEAYYPDKED